MVTGSNNFWTIKVGYWLATILTISILLSVDANAQSGGIKLLANVGGVLPTGDLKDVAAPGLAVNVYLGFMFRDNLGVEGHIGYHKFGEEEASPGVNINGAYIPIKIGLVKLWGASKRFYTNPSFGIYNGASDFEGSDFGMGPRIGYLFPLGDGSTMLDVAGEFHTIFSDPDKVNYFGLYVGVVLDLAGK